MNEMRMNQKRAQERGNGGMRTKEGSERRNRSEGRGQTRATTEVGLNVEPTQPRGLTG